MAPTPQVSGPQLEAYCYAPGMDTADTIRAALQGAKSVLDALLADQAALAAATAIADAAATAIAGNNKILICGNGGSLCDAAHFAEEFTGRFRNDRRPLPAIACTEPGHITCTANDFGFEQIFARWVTALGRKGDVLIILSTSGNSRNCVLAAEAAKAAGVTTCALLGKGGGQLKGRCSHELVVPGTTADRIQELHMLVLHAVVEAIELRVPH